MRKRVSGEVEVAKSSAAAHGKRYKELDNNINNQFSSRRQNVDEYR